MTPRNAKQDRKTQDDRSEIPKRQELYQSFFAAANKDDETALQQLLATAYNAKYLDESIIRIGLQQSVRKGYAPSLSVVITWGETSGLIQRNDDLLRIALQDAAKLGHAEAARILLEHGAKTDVGSKGSSALWWSCSQPETPGHVEVTELLLTGKYTGCPADKEWTDEDGRTIFMSAAERGHFGSLLLLLNHGVDYNARDSNDRTIMHILAAAPEKKYRHSDKCIELLLAYPISIDKPDTTSRTALHWAASTGKATLLEHLLKRSKHPPADPNCESSRGKTALHLACSAEPPNLDVVRLLLKHSADTSRTSDGHWTCLHHAAQVKCSGEVIYELVSHSPNLLNIPTSTGMTALHIAASAGFSDVVACLLTFEDTKINARDGFYWTPLLRAAGSNHMEIVQQLAPYNNTSRLSSHAVHASRGFEATIVDFRAESHHSTLVQKRSVYDVLYGREADDEPLLTTVVEKVKTRVGTSKPLFRWIHLPANNIAWVEALIVKHFVESGSSDIDGFKDVEKSFGQQHRGPKYHSQFMKPICQRTPRAPNSTENITMLREVDANLKRPKVPSSINLTELSGKQKGHKKDLDVSTAGRASPRGPRASHSKKHGPDRSRRGFSAETDDSGTGGEPAASDYAGSNMVIFMPYLHYETSQGRLSQRDAIRRSETTTPGLRRQPSCNDEALIFAHLESTTGLHLRRTLHQYYLHGVDTGDRDAEQVVGRYIRAQGTTEEKIFMVDQLWLWVLGPELIISAFPRRWRQPRNDPLDVLDGVLEDINSGMRTKRIVSPYELVTVITNRCSGVFDRHRAADDETYRFLEIFERSIGDVTYQEPTLYSNFYKASATVHQWFKSLETHEPERAAEYFAAVDRFLEIGEETALLQEIKDIREELHMISMVLNSQDLTLATASDAVCEEYVTARNHLEAKEMERRFDEQKKLISSNLAEISRMTDMAGVLEQSLLNLLDLKQKQSNAFEARYARDQQAAGIVRQGQITLVFTIVTILFLPVSFMAAFFAIPISDFPGGISTTTSPSTSNNNNTNPLSLAYVAKYTFGIGLGISFLIITLAFNMDAITLLLHRSKIKVAILLRLYSPRRSVGGGGIGTGGGGGGINGGLDDSNLGLGRGGGINHESKTKRPWHRLARAKARATPYGSTIATGIAIGATRASFADHTTGIRGKEMEMEMYGLMGAAPSREVRGGGVRSGDGRWSHEGRSHNGRRSREVPMRSDVRRSVDMISLESEGAAAAAAAATGIHHRSRGNPRGFPGAFAAMSRSPVRYRGADGADADVDGYDDGDDDGDERSLVDLERGRS